MTIDARSAAGPGTPSATPFASSSTTAPTRSPSWASPGSGTATAWPAPPWPASTSPPPSRCWARPARVDQISVIADDGLDPSRRSSPASPRPCPRTSRRSGARRWPPRAPPRCSPVWRSYPGPPRVRRGVAARRLLRHLEHLQRPGRAATPRGRPAARRRRHAPTGAGRHPRGGRGDRPARHGIGPPRRDPAVGIRRLLVLVGVEVPSTTVALEPRTSSRPWPWGSGSPWSLLRSAWARDRGRADRSAAGGRASHRDVKRPPRTGRRLRAVAGTLGLVACAVVGDQLAADRVRQPRRHSSVWSWRDLHWQATARLASHGRRGGGWRLAARNVPCSPRRAAATAMALTIGVAVVSAVAVTAHSLQESVGQTVSPGIRADFLLQPVGPEQASAPPLPPRSAPCDGVDAVVELKYAGAGWTARDRPSSASIPPTSTKVLDLGIGAGALDLGPGPIAIAAPRRPVSAWGSVTPSCELPRVRTVELDRHRRVRGHLDRGDRLALPRVGEGLPGQRHVDPGPGRARRASPDADLTVTRAAIISRSPRIRTSPSATPPSSPGPRRNRPTSCSGW